MSRSGVPRRGFSLPELLLALVIAGVATAVGVRQMRHWLDRTATRAAAQEAALAIGRARDEALARDAVVALRVDTLLGTIALTSAGERLALYALAHEHGVRLSVTRDSIAFDVRGLGYGAANLTLVARRGDAADTVVVSRLGRTR